MAKLFRLKDPEPGNEAQSVFNSLKRNSIYRTDLLYRVLSSEEPNDLVTLIQTHGTDRTDPKGKPEGFNLPIQQLGDYNHTDYLWLSRECNLQKEIEDDRDDLYEITIDTQIISVYDARLMEPSTDSEAYFFKDVRKKQDALKAIFTMPIL